MTYTKEQYIDLINQALETYLYAVNDGQDIVVDAMRYSVRNGGKRVRPMLVLEFCRVCGGNVEDALPFACALEMIHTYSLIHDDLPCMDDDDMRRGKPSCHKQFGEAYALLAGDGLLTLAFETLTKAKNIDASDIVRAVQTLSERSGVSGMIGGQVIDLLSEDGEPKNVAGVPPDYFSEFGQKWGNPLYNWKAMQADGYRWWMDRLGACFKLFDAVRIDHFRAFSAYWAVPAEAETAKEGKWIDGPKTDFFDTVNRTFKNPKIIAEDLGIIDEGVIDLLEKTGLPCMRVMQFGFMEQRDNMHLPHNYPKNCVAYTGTHDNNTVLGWLWEALPHERAHALEYCGFPGGDWAVGGSDSASCRAMIRTLWQSPANTVIVPVQDLCGFGKDTKMNVPGVPNGNWAFRLSQEQMDGIDKDWLRKLNQIYYRAK